MAGTFAHLDWSLVQAFLAVAESGSLSAAARRVGVSQPTLGRQVRALETALRADLFHRQPRGLVLTATGAALLEPARAMQMAAGQLSLLAAGQDHGLAGTVRITASNIVSHFVLPPILARIRDEHPEIALDLVPSDASENLLFREADIALRMYRPTQLDMVTRHLGDIALGLFGATGYLQAHGRPRTADDLMEHQFVGFDRSDLIMRNMRAQGMVVDRDFFGIRCDDQAVYWHLLRAGCGLGFGQLKLGLDDPLLEQVLPGLPLPPLPVWLTAHQAMRNTPRIRRVWDMLAQGLAPHLA